MSRLYKCLGDPGSRTNSPKTFQPRSTGVGALGDRMIVPVAPRICLMVRSAPAVGN